TVTDTAAEPAAPAGVTVVIWPPSCTENVPTAMPPIVTCVAPMKLEPEMVTWSPPRVVPLAWLTKGDPTFVFVICVTIGVCGPRYRKLYEALLPSGSFTVTGTAPAVAQLGPFAVAVAH